MLYIYIYDDKTVEIKKDFKKGKDEHVREGGLPTWTDCLINLVIKETRSHRVTKRKRLPTHLPPH